MICNNDHLIWQWMLENILAYEDKFREKIIVVWENYAENSIVISRAKTLYLWKQKYNYTQCQQEKSGTTRTFQKGGLETCDRKKSCQELGVWERCDHKPYQHVTMAVEGVTETVL